jgi:septum formation topological specificity factor MinE
MRYLCKKTGKKLAHNYAYLDVLKKNVIRILNKIVRIHNNAIALNQEYIKAMYRRVRAAGRRDRSHIIMIEIGRD